ncbi:MAG: S-methyl-5-thioribose-1-phosphate isomerase [Candidatus Sericytochromatia bacterium]|nr:S-methyl-5-thioribose-1-phosphate isomerase [Candidatus Sericytochromatia bacterium]
MIHPVRWQGDHVSLIDQTRLPVAEVWIRCDTWQEVAAAIRHMQVRGAPAIGAAAAMGMALAARPIAADSTLNPLDALLAAQQGLAATRPTAVNLFWALERMTRRAVAAGSSGSDWATVLTEEACLIHDEDVAMCRAIGDFGAGLLPAGARILTHCNAGALATAGYGTALGVVRSAHAQGKVSLVYVDETRPWMQGARLTAWELRQEGIEHRLIADNMAGHFLHRGAIDCVIVGADRIAANGDVANKIGTYSVAVLAKENGIPFFVAAPSSTLDLSLTTGDGIPIEERSEDEVTHLAGHRIAPEGTRAMNPAFDVTPARYVSAIITEAGVMRPPYEASLATVAGARLKATT